MLLEDQRKIYFCHMVSNGIKPFYGVKRNLRDFIKAQVLGDPGVTANIYCKSLNLPNTGTQNYSTDLR